MLALSDIRMPALVLASEHRAVRPRSAGLAPVNPLADARWDDWLGVHPEATFFHTTAWARVLQEAYGHEPYYFAGPRRGEAGGPLLPVMEVNSPWLGRRGVSLPFTDWCPPLGSEPEAAQSVFEQALEHGRARGWRYFETRGGTGPGRGPVASVAYLGHEVDLVPGETRLFQALDPAVRRAIRKAQNSAIRVEIETSPAAMEDYYQLHCRTRRRHGLPPQPHRFFQAITRHVLAAGHGLILTARLHGRLVAGAIFFHHRDTAIYKFGASDPAFHALRPNNLLLWQAMTHYLARGCRTLHLGRTSLANPGLRRFKLSFAAREHRLEYCRYWYAARRFVSGTDRTRTWANHVFRLLPMPCLRFLGARLYPHLT
jgi:hypothetical protein